MIDELNQLSLVKCSECTCFNLRKAARAVTQLFDKALQPLGLLSTQFSVLAAVALRGSETIHELADQLGMDRTTLSRNLRPLEQQGWVEVVPGKDRRTRVVLLTKEGRKILARAYPLWEKAQAGLKRNLGERWHQLLGNLSATVQAAQS